MPKLGDITRYSNHNYIWSACIDCGKERWVQLDKGKVKSQRCSSCAGKHAWQIFPHRYSPNGKTHWGWKGGRYTSGSGYLYILRSDHHRANKLGYVAEHIFVWEKAHNQPLPDGWVVHHLNGKKQDNRPENLLGMAKRGHSSTLLLKEVQKKVRKLEAKLAQQRLC